MFVINVKEKVDFEIFGGRGGLFGNPFRIGKDGDRKQVIEKFKIYFWNRINEDEDFRKECVVLKDKVVGCYCKPLDCHLDVIVSWLDKGAPIKGENGAYLYYWKGEWGEFEHS